LTCPFRRVKNLPALPSNYFPRAKRSTRNMLNRHRAFTGTIFPCARLKAFSDRIQINFPDRNRAAKIILSSARGYIRVGRDGGLCVNVVAAVVSCYARQGVGRARQIGLARSDLETHRQDSAAVARAMALNYRTAIEPIELAKTAP
jgi:hypothetical protein